MIMDSLDKRQLNNFWTSPSLSLLFIAGS